MRKNDETLLLVAASEGDANMLYATAFFAPDPFIFFSHRGRKYMVMSDLEIDRAKQQAEVDQVLSLSKYQSELQKHGLQAPTTADVLQRIFHERGIRRVVVPANFPTLLADELRARGFVLTVRKDPFFP
ncbi:MAG: M24 family metallopeptidase, partial [Candidatus Binatia bacterium]